MSNKDNMVLGILTPDLYRLFLNKAKANGGEQEYLKMILRTALEGELVITPSSEDPQISHQEMIVQIENLRTEVASLRQEIETQMTALNNALSHQNSVVTQLRTSQFATEKIFTRLLDQAAE